MKIPKVTEQFTLAIMWSFAAIGWITFILIKYGGDKGVLNLIIGLISGAIINSLFGTYFSANTTKKTDVPPGTTTTTDAVVKTVTTAPTDSPTT